MSEQEWLDTTTLKAYINTLCDGTANDDVYRGITTILTKGVIDTLNADGWYLQHIQELQDIARTLTAFEAQEPSMLDIKRRLDSATYEYIRMIERFQSHPLTRSRIDILRELGVVLFHAVWLLHLNHEVEQFFTSLLPLIAMAGVTLEQAFIFSSLPQYRYITYKKKEQPDWNASDDEGPRGRTIHYAISQWAEGKSLSEGKFGPFSYGLEEGVPDSEE